MTPIILGIETATDACSVALLTAQQTFAQHVIAPQAHSKLVLSMVDTVLDLAGIKLDQVQAFAFGQGPGSFTGLRIAASVVQGLAFGVDKPVIAVSTLQALAQQAYNILAATRVLAILDARMQEVYAGFYMLGPNNLMVGEYVDCLQKPGDLIVPGDLDYIVVGTGSKAYSEILLTHNTKLIFAPDIEYPRAAEIVQLAAQQYLEGNVLSASQAIPAYVRNDVVQTGKKNPD